jgi:transposase
VLGVALCRHYTVGVLPSDDVTLRPRCPTCQQRYSRLYRMQRKRRVTKADIDSIYKRYPSKVHEYVPVSADAQ